MATVIIILLLLCLGGYLVITNAATLNFILSCIDMHRVNRDMGNRISQTIIITIDGYYYYYYFVTSCL